MTYGVCRLGWYLSLWNEGKEGTKYPAPAVFSDGPLTILTGVVPAAKKKATQIRDRFASRWLVLLFGFDRTRPCEYGFCGLLLRVFHQVHVVPIVMRELLFPSNS
jgi:hypothetical protein